MIEGLLISEKDMKNIKRKRGNKMIEEAYISFDTAKMLDGIEFHCVGCYTENGSTDALDVMNAINNKEKLYPRLPQSLLARWLRDKHKLFIEITIDFMRLIIEDNPTKYYTIYYYKIINLKNSSCINNRHEYYSYEKALETGLQEALKLLR